MEENYVDDEASHFSIVDYEEDKCLNTPDRTVNKHPNNYDLLKYKEDDSSAKSTIVQSLTLTQENVKKLREEKQNLLYGKTDQEDDLPEEIKNLSDSDDIDDSYVDLRFEEDKSIEEDEEESPWVEAKIKKMNSDFSINNLSDKNRASKEKAEEDDKLQQKIDESYISIHQSDYESIPKEQEEDDFVNNFKGAVLEGFTNFNYYLTDTGMMSIMGVKKLDFSDKEVPVKLYNKSYFPYQKATFTNEFEKIMWFTYRNNFKPLMSRKNFLGIEGIDPKKENINKNILTSDNGWGCMIRVAQMLLARAICQHLHSLKSPIIVDYFDETREQMQSICDLKSEIEKENKFKRSVIKLFLDNLNDGDAPFSIQNFVEHGYKRYKKVPGDWYGANSAAIILENLNTLHKPERGLEVIVFNDNGIFENRCLQKAKINCDCKRKQEEYLLKQKYEIISDDPAEINESIQQSPGRIDFSCEECRYFENGIQISPNKWNEKFDDSDNEEHEQSFDFNTTREWNDRNWVKSLLIIRKLIYYSNLINLESIRLGMESIPDEYYSSIKRVFDIPQWVGIMGGKKNKALYFVGHEGDYLIFLDPHYVTDAIPEKDVDDFSVKSYTWKTPKKLSMGNLDPWLAIGYYIRDSNDFEDFKDAIKKQNEVDPNFKAVCNIHDRFVKSY